MKHFVRYANGKTLLLIDEFGGGTEPQIGGAIAESILAKLNDNGAYGVITTHYTNLKLFAEDTMGIENGAMLYDRHNMQPLFQLEIGRPGSSFAVEIARKIGLPEHIIQMATEIVGTEQVDYDKYLQDIARDKRYWENKRQKIRLQEKKLEETIARYEGEMNSIHKTRKELINQAKKEAMDLLQQSNAVIENTIRKIKESQADKENTKAARQDLEAFKEKIAPAHPQKVKKQKVQNVLDTLKVGDSVTIKGQSMIGHVLDIQGKKLTVAMGQLKTTLSISEVEKISNNQMRKQGKMIPSSRAGSDEIRRTKLSFKQDIDLRGMRADEAVQAVMYFIDDAVMVGAGTVRILHGTGTGALRQAIRQYLSTVASVKSFRDEHIQLGGVGITVVELDD
jgi:DNA mismatch repair protein MutS2